MEWKRLLEGEMLYTMKNLELLTAMQKHEAKVCSWLAELVCDGTGLMKDIKI